jgi:type III pantothenate kinase
LKEEEVAIVATGGLAPLLARGSKHFKKVIPFLTLEGLEIVYYLNKNR